MNKSKFEVCEIFAWYKTVQTITYYTIVNTNSRFRAWAGATLTSGQSHILRNTT